MAPKDDGTGAAGAATARRHRARARAEGSCNCDGPSGREETRNEESGSEKARCEEGRSERTRGSEETGRREGREGEALTWPDRSTSPLTDRKRTVRTQVTNENLGCRLRLETKKNNIIDNIPRANH